MEKIFAFGICLYRYKNSTIQILLCKSVQSKERWGFLKGVKIGTEIPTQTALREFFEESSIVVKNEHLEQFFLQENELKDIGIYLVNYTNIEEGEKYFLDDSLYERYLSKENSKVKFFSLDKLPLIKKKQKYLVNEVAAHLHSLMGE